MTVLLTMAEYKTSLSVFAAAAIALGIFAYATLRDDPIEAGMYPDNVTKEVYEAEYKNLTDHEDYVSDWTIPMMLRCKMCIRDSSITLRYTPFRLTPEVRSLII